MDRSINEALAAKVNHLEAERLDAEMKDGYLATRRERAQLDTDWSALNLEHWPE